ncbi:DNA binding helix-turn helix protein [Haematococcus lacustris]
MQMNAQDWEPVVIRKKQLTNSDLKDEAAVNAARRAGVAVATEKKFNAGTNNKAAVTTTTGKSAAKLEAETEDFHRACHHRVSSTLKTQIIQARTAKKMTQAQLAQAINEKPQIIQEYESGKAIPNPQVLSKLSRILGVTLKKSS